MSQHTNHASGGVRFRLTVLKTVGPIVVVILVFCLGVVVGRGKAGFGFVNRQQQVAKGLPANLDYSSVEAVYDKVRTGYDGQLDTAKVLDGLKEGLAQATGDPYTEYFNPTDAKTFQDQLDGTFSGIGAELGKDAGNNIVVISPLSGYPAEKAGLKAKDAIESVDGTAVTGLTVDEVVGKIRGKEGTKVTLKVIRNNTQELSFEITRQQIKIPSVKSSVDNGIGYLQIVQFSDDTVGLAQQAAENFKQANVRGVILDLRSDPGGLLDSAVGVSSLWLDQSQVVLREKRGGVDLHTYNATTTTPPLKGIPTVVLINEGSASASEITAGALRDNNVARLMGEKSFGKGSVQQLENLGDGSLLKVTIAHWFTPAGNGIDKKGITPDKTVAISDDDVKNGRDPQKQAAIDFLTK